MSVQELSQLHRRYIDLSERFKAAWTFHQFLQGVQKVFVDEEVARDLISFQEVYTRLKSISQNLNTAATDELRHQLDDVDGELNEKMQILIEEDNRISPSLLRQFFQRVKSYDEKILSQLLRFYVLTNTDNGWEQDRIDKVDFLITKLGEEIQGLKVAAILRDPTRVKEIFQSLWSSLGEGLPSEGRIEEYKSAILGIRREVGEIGNLDELNDKKCVPRYRSLKHELGNLLFEPDIAPTVLETNLFFRQSIQKLYEAEERRITTEYLEVFELERDASPDTELDQDLKQFRLEIESFENQLQAKNVRLEELAYIRGRVRTLIPRLRAAVASKTGDVEELETEQPVSTPVVVPGLEERVVSFRTRDPEEGFLDGYLAQVETALKNTDGRASPRAIVVSPEVQPLRLSSRDVESFRRLLKDQECDRELEEFVLQAAALRVRINEEAEEIAGLRDLTSNEVEEDILTRARQTCRVADSFEKRFSHFITLALQDGELTEAQKLQVLRMRLLRDYAGLWLLAHGPL